MTRIIKPLPLDRGAILPPARRISRYKINIILARELYEMERAEKLRERLAAEADRRAALPAGIFGEAVNA